MSVACPAQPSCCIAVNCRGQALNPAASYFTSMLRTWWGLGAARYNVRKRDVMFVWSDSQKKYDLVTLLD